MGKEQSFYFNLFVFLFFVAVLGLCCCVRAFSSCSEWGLLFVAVQGLLIVVASLVAGYRLQACRLQQLQHAGSRAQGLRQLRHMGSRVHRHQQSWHTGSVVVARGLRAQAHQLWHTGLAAPRHVGSSGTRDQTRVPCTSRQILNHCATREVPEQSF